MRKYRLVAKKGEGTFSEVLKAQNVKDGKYYAIKCMKNHFDNIEQVNNLREIQALRRLSPHSHVITLEEVLYDQPTGRLALVFELMDANLYELIRGRRHYLNAQLVKSYVHQLLKALDHMHRKGIFHRDIKPENILIEGTGEIGRGLKLADFGSCRGIYSKQPYTEYISTRWYRAPECLLTDGYYGPEMDLWGAGCVFFEISSLYPLFPGTNELDQINRIHKVLGTPKAHILAKFRQNGASHIDFNFSHQKGIELSQLLPHAPPDCIDLLTQLLKYDWTERITAREGLKHAYFKDLREMEMRQQQQQQPSQQKQQPRQPQQLEKPQQPTPQQQQATQSAMDDKNVKKDATDAANKYGRAQKRQAAAAPFEGGKYNRMINGERERKPGVGNAMGTTMNEVVLGDSRLSKPSKDSPKALPSISGNGEGTMNVLGPKRKGGRVNATRMPYHALSNSKPHLATQDGLPPIRGIMGNNTFSSANTGGYGYKAAASNFGRHGGGSYSQFGVASQVHEATNYGQQASNKFGARQRRRKPKANNHNRGGKIFGVTGSSSRTHGATASHVKPSGQLGFRPAAKGFGAADRRQAKAPGRSRYSYNSQGA